MTPEKSAPPRVPRKVAFIGTGNMGMPLIERLLDAGYRVQLYDKYAANRERLSGDAITWHETPRTACANVETAITCLPLPHHVLENMLGEEGALAGLGVSTTWIDTSTTDYHNTRHIAAIAKQRGVFSLEAPVSNLSHMGVDFANVCFYVGGDTAAYTANEALFRAMGRKTFHVGDILMGQTVKLFTNLLFYTALVVWGDVLVVARRSGLPLIWFWNHARESKANCFVVDQLTPFILDGSYDRSCTLEIGVKDTDLVVKLAQEEKCPMPIGTIIRDRYAAADRKYAPLDNHVLVVQLSETEADVPLQVEDFAAPSPYGQNAGFVRSTRMVSDVYGRIKPQVEPEFYASAPMTDLGKIAVADDLVNFMAVLNYAILKETRRLARRKGLDDDLITEVVRWSCGPSWVADHESAYRPDHEVLAKMADLSRVLPVATLRQVVSVLRGQIDAASPDIIAVAQ